MATDARISTGLPSHPKTKKLMRRLGAAGALACVYLFLWAAANRSDGDLSGMSDEDIELAVDWTGDEGAFVQAMESVGFLDGAEGERVIHDWHEHNPWAAGSEARSEKSRWAALCRRHGRQQAARMMPEYAERLQEARQPDAQASQPHANGTPAALPDAASGMPLAGMGSAPSPIPIPSPIPTPTLEKPSSSAKPTDARFDRFWRAYPRKVGKDAARKAFEKRKPDDGLLQAMVSAIERQGLEAKCKRGESQFVPHPATWLNEGRWQDELPIESSGSSWWLPAGFANVYEANNAGCFAHNAAQFRDGKRVEVPA